MKKSIALILALSILLCMTGCGTFTAEVSSGKSTSLVDTKDYDSGIRKFIKAVEASDYTEAISQYSDKIYGDASMESQARQFLYDYMSAALDAFNAETLAGSEFDGILLTVQKVDNTLNIVSDLLSNVEAEYDSLASSKESFQSGTAALENGEYLNAATFFDSVYVNDTNYTAAQTYRDEAMQSYQEEVVASAKAKIEAGEYETAAGILDTASAYTGWLSEYDELAKQAVTLAAEKAVSDALDAGDYPTAQSNYYAYMSDYTQYSVELISRLETAKTEYREQTIQNAQQLAAENNYTGALSALDAALLVLEDDSELLRAQEDIQAEYDDYLLRTTPVSLADLEAYNTEGWIGSSSDSTKDIFGNVYSPFMYTGNYGKYIYRINGIYKTFSGTFFVKTTDDDYGCSAEIYGDGVLIYSVTVYGGEDPTNFNIDITGVRDLTVFMDRNGTDLYLGNPILTP